MKDFPQLKGFKGSPGLVRLIGHRGARGLMPENTIEGFEFTLDMGVTALEFDVLVSKDNVPVITHDNYLSGASTSCLLYTSPSPRDGLLSRMPSSA